MLTSMVPIPTILQFAPRESIISRVEGRRARARNASVSASDLRIQNKKGMMRQPTSRGTRHPQASICARVSTEFSQTPDTQDSHKNHGALLARRLPGYVETSV